MPNQNSSGRNPFDGSLSRAALSRRSVFAGLAGLGAVGLLSACGSAGTNSSAAKTPAYATDLSDSQKIVNWSNWPAYIDTAGDKIPTLEAFAKQTGIKVNYTEDYNDNDSFYAKMKPVLEAKQDTGRDVWCSTDWMVARLISLGYVLPLDKANIPNAANLEPSLANAACDPGRVYSLPWQSYFAGIGYNPKGTKGQAVTSMDQLLHDSALKGKVTLLSEMRDTVGLVLMEQGKKLDSFTADDFAGAIAALQEAVDSGQIKQFTGNEYIDMLKNNEIAACVAWSGDVISMRADVPNMGYTLPEKGFTRSTDNLLIPAMAQHKANTEKLINYYYDPAVMAKVAMDNYMGPVVGTKAILEKSDPSVAKNDLIFPSDATVARAQVFRPLTADEETSFSQQFQALSVG
jgi:spermidine/putrescine transport system substrate-binding protein